MKHPWRWIIGSSSSASSSSSRLLPGGEKLEFEVAGEFERHVLIELPTIGPFDMSITKTVAYLFIAVAVIVVATIVVARRAQGAAGPLPVRDGEPSTSWRATASSARS